MEVARLRAYEGAPHGTTVVARFQRQGRGRRGRTWTAPAGSGLLLTTIVRPTPSPERPLPLFGLVAGVAIWRACRRLGADAAMLKWPNDVVVGDRKLAGILLEAEDIGGPAPLVLVGVGLNLAARERLGALPPDVDARYIGLTEALHADRDDADARFYGDALQAVVQALEEACDEWEASGPAPLLAAFRGADALRSKRVRADAEHGPIEGIADGITELGALRVRTQSGIVEMSTGEVVQVRETESR